MPGVVGADEAIAFRARQLDSAQRQLCSAMDAEVAPAVQRFGGTPEDDVASHEAAGVWFAGGDLAGPGDGEPFLQEAGVVEAGGLVPRVSDQREGGCHAFCASNEFGLQRTG